MTNEYRYITCSDHSGLKQKLNFGKFPAYLLNTFQNTFGLGYRGFFNPFDVLCQKALIHSYTHRKCLCINEVKAFEPIEPSYYFTPTIRGEQPKPESREQDITELENYFAGIELPTHPIKLNPYSPIINVSLFIESHFATVKANNGKRIFLPYLNRLQELKTVIKLYV